MGILSGFLSPIKRTKKKREMPNQQQMDPPGQCRCLSWNTLISPTSHQYLQMGKAYIWKGNSPWKHTKSKMSYRIILMWKHQRASFLTCVSTPSSKERFNCNPYIRKCACRIHGTRRYASKAVFFRASPHSFAKLAAPWPLLLQAQDLRFEQSLIIASHTHRNWNMPCRLVKIV